MNNITPKIEDTSRAQIAKFLPDALKTALDSYHHFATQNVTTTEAKEFGAHHTACKVAIAHIDLLLKLARWADLPDPAAADFNQQIVLAAVIGEAENELRASPYIDAEFIDAEFEEE